MKFVCPSCAAVNRCPDAAAGLVIICRKCRTQATVPQPPGGVRVRSWLTSPGWLAVVFLELLGVAGLALAVRALWSHPTVTAPWARPGADGRVPQLTLAGKMLPVEWAVTFPTLGGYYLIDKPRVTLKSEDGEPRVLQAHWRDDPWPADFPGSSDAPPQRPTKLVRFQVDVPAGSDLTGRRAVLGIRADLRYLEGIDQRPAARLAVAKMHHELVLFVADEPTLATIRKHKHTRDMLRRAVFASALVIVCVAVGAFVFGQKRLKIMCPKCSRATIVTYHHERGPLTTTDCPHTGATVAPERG